MRIRDLRRAARPSRPKTRRQRPALECLEERALMSIGFTQFKLPPDEAPIGPLTEGSDGNVWFIFEDFGNFPGKLARITPGGVVTEYPLPSSTARPLDITNGPDGNVWFIDYDRNAGTGLPLDPSHFKIGRITPAGQIREFTLPTGVNGPLHITAGPDGNLWFTELGAPRIGRMTTQGMVTQFSVPVGGVGVIAPGKNNDLWLTSNENKLVRLTTAGQASTFPLPLPVGALPNSLAVGPDDNVWVAVSPGFTSGPAIDRMTPAGTVTSVSTNFLPGSITAGPDGNLWVTAHGLPSGIARITPTFGITVYALPYGSPKAITSGPGDTLWYSGVGIGEADLQATDFPLEAVPASILAFTSHFDLLGNPLLGYDSFGGRVASFIDLDPHAQASDFLASVEYRDMNGQPVTDTAYVVANGQGGFNVFAAPSHYDGGPLSVHIFDNKLVNHIGGATANVQATVSTFPLPVAGGISVSALNTASTGVAARAGFPFQLNAYRASDLSLFVDWGDGTRLTPEPFKLNTIFFERNGGPAYYNEVDANLGHVYAHHGLYVVHAYLIKNGAIPLSAPSTLVVV